jgi:uncharacterized iron-regulated membrane protein
MGFLRSVAFYLGLTVGLLSVAVAGTVALTYLFTGKFPSVEMAGGKAEVTLMTPDEVVAMVRQQVEQAKASQSSVTGGESHV